MISLLSRWTRPRSRLNVAHLRLTVYARAQCCCCHKALDLLKSYQHRYKFMIDEVDIDSDPELVERYNTAIPVVTIDGKVRFKGVVNPMLLKRLLVAESRER